MSLLIDNAEREQLFDQATATVRTYRLLHDDWDSGGSLRPSDRAIDCAERLLAYVRTMPDVSAPFVASIDSGVYLEWRLHKSNLYLEIDANSVLTVVRENGTVSYSTENSLSDLESAVRLIERFHDQAK